MQYLFIEKYRSSSLKEVSSFAKGLQNDLAAVENAVASPLSNGFVEGTNNMPNYRKTDEGKVYDIVAGTFVIAGLTDDDYCSLDDSVKESRGQPQNGTLQ